MAVGLVAVVVGLRPRGAVLVCIPAAEQPGARLLEVADRALGGDLLLAHGFLPRRRGQVIAAWPPLVGSGGLGVALPVGVGQRAVADAARDLLAVLAGQAALGPLGFHLGQVH